MHYGTTKGQENLRKVCIALQQETSLPEEHVRFVLFMMKIKFDSFIKIEFASPKNQHKRSQV